ncbi:glycosyltransferase family 2 protein, partial [Bacteroidota bacterium]
TDNSLEKIQKLGKKDINVKGISFSRNFGHMVALYAGIEKSIGDIVIMMDSDMQHPPSLIHELINKHKEGYNIVNTKRIDDKSIGFFKNISSKLFYKLINLISEIHIEPSSSDFRLMDRKAVNAFLSITERDRFTRGLVQWIGYKQTIIEYQALPRNAGKTKYSLKKMIRFAIDGITSFSSKPLKLATYLGFLILFITFIYALYIIAVFIKGNTIPGWTSLILVVIFIGSIQLITIGIIGEYIRRIFNESKARPHYFIKDTIN